MNIGAAKPETEPRTDVVRIELQRTGPWCWSVTSGGEALGTIVQRRDGLFSATPADLPGEVVGQRIATVAAGLVALIFRRVRNVESVSIVFDGDNRQERPGVN